MGPDALEAIALAVRQQLHPGISEIEAVPLAGLRRRTAFETVAGTLLVRCFCMRQLPDHVYAMTTISLDEERATIWLHRDAWPEVPTGVPRTRFSIAHELGHVVLHAEELDGLTTRAEADHHERLELEANRFAAHLLIPDGALKRLERRDLTPDAIAKRFGVSAMTAGRRLAEWGL